MSTYFESLTYNLCSYMKSSSLTPVNNQLKLVVLSKYLHAYLYVFEKFYDPHLDVLTSNL